MKGKPALPKAKPSFPIALLSGLALGAIASLAHAEKKPDLTPEQTAAVEAVGDYINGFRSLQGEFTQISPKGTVSKGVFYLKKPGKMRFEYSPPNPFIIVSDGTWVTIKNREKDRADQYPLSQTPLRLVLDDNVNIYKEADILDVQSGDGIVTVTLEDKKKTVPGHLVLTYDEKQKALQQWIIVDGQGRQTTVSLENVVAGVDADPKLFTIKVTRRGQKKD
ncbi:MAG: LolA family protein [Hyphomicrobiales bacterium]